ncbi:MAG: DUF4259 domain-containing protein [Pseudomonadota bacterium]
MGAWGTGPFENDDALDFASEIGDIAALESVVADAEEADFIEADQASRCLVVAECVAASSGHPHADIPEELAATIAALGPLPQSLVESAREAVSIVTTSELAELWAESDDRANWNGEIHNLIERLNAPVLERRKAAMEASKPSDKPSPNPAPCMICGEVIGMDDYSEISITIDSGYGPFRQGGCVHLACLNRALHPAFMIQNWQFDDAALDGLADGDPS